jgi:mRNA interferase MazF
LSCNQITSVTKRANDPAHLLIEVSTPDGKQTGLLRDSVVSCINLNTLDERRIKRVIGRFSPDLMKKADACLRAALKL